MCIYIHIYTYIHVHMYIYIYIYVCLGGAQLLGRAKGVQPAVEGHQGLSWEELLCYVCVYICVYTYVCIYVYTM